jgi:chorismate mutase
MEIEKLVLPGIGEDVRPTIIAGPCSAETREQVLRTAEDLCGRGVKIFRAGIWKPRTKPGGFEGVGTEGLPWLKEVKQKTGMLVATEVATAEHVAEAVSAGMDILWIGARTAANPFAMQELADALKGIDIPVLVKNPVNPDLELWIGALERLVNAGISNIGVILRGFSTYDQKIYRNLPLWHIPIELKRRYPNITMFCDPSHIGGRRDLVAPVSQQAMELKFDGLMIECHCSPDNALSDAGQQITPEDLENLVKGLVIRENLSGADSIELLRKQIDDADRQLLELLARRNAISKEIGMYKKENNMPVLQTGRYNEILEKRARMGETLGLDRDFVLAIMKSIHEESVKIQLNLE